MCFVVTYVVALACIKNYVVFYYYLLMFSYLGLFIVIALLVR